MRVLLLTSCSRLLLSIAEMTKLIGNSMATKMAAYLNIIRSTRRRRRGILVSFR